MIVLRHSAGKHPPTAQCQIDKKLDDILQKALTRDRDLRFQSASDMLVALELYIYSDGYGPTNEKLADYLNKLFADGKAWLNNPKFTDNRLKEHKNSPV